MHVASRLLGMSTSHHPLLLPQEFAHLGVSAAANRKSHISVISGTQVLRGSSNPELATICTSTVLGA